MSRFFLVDTNFYATPSAVDADEGAVGFWALLGSWSAHQRTAGFIPRTGCPLLSHPEADKCINELSRVKLIHEHEDGWTLGHGKQDWYTAYSFDMGERRAKIPNHIRQGVYDRDGRKCVTCGSVDDLTLDHIHPWSLGGSDLPGNLQTMCRPCNSSKGARV